MQKNLIRYIKLLFQILLCLSLGIFIRYWIEEYKLIKEQSELEKDEEPALCHSDSLRLKVISVGDVKSYIELRDSFEYSPFPHELLFYSIVMAKQYGYLPAYRDASKSLKTFYNYPSMRPMDSFTDSVYKAFFQREKRLSDHRDSTDHFSAKALVK